jgi:hypothetical protein
VKLLGVQQQRGSWTGTIIKVIPEKKELAAKAMDPGLREKYQFEMIKYS